MATLKTFENGMKYIELIGEGKNISNTYARIYFSRSGLNIAEEIANNDDIEDKVNEILKRTELYHNQKGQAILTAKKDAKTITFNDYIESSFRGTSWVEEINNGDVVSATGNGRIGEHTDLIATLKDGGYLIVGFNGRYRAGYKIYKNDDGELKTEIFANEGKYVDMFDLDEAKMLFGIKDVCEVIGDKEKEKADLIKKILGVDEVEITDECGRVEFIVKKDNYVITISNIEEIE